MEGVSSLRILSVHHGVHLSHIYICVVSPDEKPVAAVVYNWKVSAFDWQRQDDAAGCPNKSQVQDEVIDY